MVTSGVLQGSVIGLSCLMFFVSDSSTDVRSVLMKFADGIKLSGIANVEEIQIIMQGDFDIFWNGA